MHYLLIGNGPSAISREMGNTIDEFPGQVVRFNAYKTRDLEKYVGRRTDIWATVGSFPSGKAYQHMQRWWLGPEDNIDHQRVREAIGATILEPQWRRLDALAYNSHPSSGKNLTAYLLSKGHRITLYGFDFMTTSREHHYADKAQRGPWHDERKEWLYFNRLLEKGTIEWLGWDRTKQGMHALRTPVPCGTPADMTALRTPSQGGWYEWAASVIEEGASALDVGAGTCAGVGLLRDKGIKAVGLDVDPRLKELDPTIIITDDLGTIPNKAYDWITCMDMLEHVIDDKVAVNHMRRIARKGVLVSTPNGERSGCKNSAHCREYSIAQFVNAFDPKELWSGSPDGHMHRTLVLERAGKYIIDKSIEGPDNSKKGTNYIAYERGCVPLEILFNNTVDGEIWPHITAVLDPA